MKKLFLFICAAALLSGCGSSKEVVKKTCTADLDGAVTVMEFEGEGDVLSKVAMKIQASYEDMGLDKETVDAFTEEQKDSAAELMKKEMLSVMDMKEEDGYTITSKFDDEGYKMEVSAEATIFEKALDATSLEEAVKGLEAEGFSCK